MMKVLTLYFILAGAFSNKISVMSKGDWTCDILAVDVENKTPDLIYIDVQITRPSRGVFRVNGIADLKEDFTNEIHISASIYYSSTGSNFIKTPFAVPDSDLTTAVNVYYKEYLMESFLNCTDNALRIENTFVPPLSKRKLILKDCQFYKDDVLPQLKSGYYKIVVKYEGYAEGSVTVLAKVEQK